MSRTAMPWLALIFSLGLMSISSPVSAFSVLSLLHLADDTSIHYRLTITLLVDGRTVSGVAVHELRAHAEARTIPGTGGISVSGAGDALTIDIPGKPTFYFPLEVARGGALSDPIAIDCGLNSTISDPVQRLDIVLNFKGPCNLKPRAWPLAVRFADDSDPSTARAVDLPETDGPDGSISIKSVTVERTEEPLTGDIQARLPWADQNKVIRVAIAGPDGRLLFATNSSIFSRR